MVCWSFSNLWSQIVKKTILPTASPADFQYVLTYLFTTLLLFTFSCGMLVVLLHLKLAYSIASRTRDTLSTGLREEVKTLVEDEKEYVRGNFESIVEAVDYFVSPAYGYLQAILQKIHSSGLTGVNGRRYTVWFVQIFIILLAASLASLVSDQRLKK